MTKPVPVGFFVGPPIHTHDNGGVAIHESDLQAGRLIPPHVHADSIISLVMRGVAEERVGQRTRDVGAQDLLFTPAYEMHSYEVHADGRWLNMEFSRDWLARHVGGAVALPEASVVLRGTGAVAWAARVRTEVRRHDAVSALAIDGAMIMLIAELSRLRLDGAQTRPRWLRAVEDAIDASVVSPPSVEQLAAIAGVHAGHLLRTFRRYHGVTIANYVRQRRIERARNEVAQAKRPLSIIALDAGFADQSHFTRVFRQAFGETPGQYARSLRGR